MNRFTKTLTILAAFSASSAYSDHPNASELRIDEVQYRGSGCPAGSVATNISPDAKAITLLFDNYLVEMNGTGPRMQKKNCEIDIHLHTSSGWQFGFFSVDHRGYVDLEAGVVASLGAGYRIDHHGRKVKFADTVFRGQTSQDYIRTESVPVHTVQWTPCSNGRGTHFTLNSEITIAGTGPGHNRGTGLITVDSIDGELKQTFGFLWKRCRSDHHDDHDDDHTGPDYSGYRGTRLIAIPGAGQCTMDWQSKRNGTLELANNGCATLAQSINNQRLKMMLLQRIKMATHQVEKEFELWKRSRHR
jgi:hypothetical protein